eukprot:53030-Eustigmatos_ZCMA.PRE.1
MEDTPPLSRLVFVHLYPLVVFASLFSHGRLYLPPPYILPSPGVEAAPDAEPEQPEPACIGGDAGARHEPARRV